MREKLELQENGEEADLSTLTDRRLKVRSSSRCDDDNILCKHSSS